jgi:hypothetical protein
VPGPDARPGGQVSEYAGSTERSVHDSLDRGVVGAGGHVRHQGGSQRGVPKEPGSTDPGDVPKQAALHDAHHEHAPRFVARWLCPTNHKDIGTLYLIFLGVPAIIAVATSVLMRIELMESGLQVFADVHA